MDIRELLGSAVPEPPPAPSPVLDADVVRGHRALRRRRVAVAGAAAGFVLACGALVLPAGPVVQDTGTRAVTLGASDAGQFSGNAGPTRPLVPYDGPQVGAFTVGLIPQGWVVQGGDAGFVTLAPADALDRDPASYANKIVVVLESAAALAEPNAELDGAPAVLVRDDLSRYTHVVVAHAAGALSLQVPPTTGEGWADEELLALAASIEVDGSVATAVG